MPGFFIVYPTFNTAATPATVFPTLQTLYKYVQVSKFHSSYEYKVFKCLLGKIFSFITMFSYLLTPNYFWNLLH